MSRLFGVTVMPEWIQSEGTDAVLGNLDLAKATAVSTSPYVMAPSDDPDAGREPPIDGGAGKVRLLDRDLWGKRELRCVTAPSFAPDRSLYRDLRYQSAEPTALTDREGGKIRAFIEHAQARGLEVHLQVQAAIPPGYRVQFGGPHENDAPRLPNGDLLPGRVDKNGSLASPEITAYGQALLRDIAQAYPTIDALRIDWPEYPPYSWPAIFFDFSAHAMTSAEKKNYDAERMQRDTLALFQSPMRLVDAGFDGAIAEYPGFADLLCFKADLVDDLLAAYRDALPSSIELVAQSFPPPWCNLSGFDHSRASRHADMIGVKLYTMHWPMMLRAYLDFLRPNGSDENRRDLAKRLSTMFNLGWSGDGEPYYPEPEEPHPIKAAAQRRKIETVQKTIPTTPVHAMAHAYGPTSDVIERVAIAAKAADGQVWLNRYGYLSDDKLKRLAKATGAADR